MSSMHKGPVRIYTYGYPIPTPHHVRGYGSRNQEVDFYANQTIE